ncbi:hypothetical protein MYXE_02550 [Mycobacterium xenopi]|uniref:Transposase n=1 Tax=Mycobacterium xenopi TaxID=1789 RepID=A0AAD1LZJ9_MYCXE|nr:hypothetical protein MYXE_02550 [Mycobacterium xenopi]
MAALAGVDRKTARSYTNAAALAGLDRGGALDQLTDELIGAVIEAVRPDRPDGHGQVWEVLRANHDQIVKWVEEGLTVVKICDLLERRGTAVPQRTLHRYCTQCTEYRGRRSAGTVPVVDGEPGVECQIDFGRMGKIFDAESGRNRVVHALIFTAVYSRHMFVWLTFNQTLEAIVAGCEAAWQFFGGVFKVLIPDNMTPIVPKADSTDPQFSVGWTEYSQVRGFFTDPARVRHPRTSRGWNVWSSTCGATSSPAKTSPTSPTLRPEPRCGVPARPPAHPRHHLSTPGGGVRRARGRTAAARPSSGLPGADLR